MPVKKLSKKIKVLITAGPTWVALDKVRVISSIFTGQTGYHIAQKFCKQGFSVTLLLGPTRFELKNKPKNTDFKLLRFQYFSELKSLIKKEIAGGSYNALVHTAAVSDYEPSVAFPGKIPSGKELIVKFKPLPKIIKEVRNIDKNIFFIQFKLETNKTKKDLVDIAYKHMLKSNTDLVVANDQKDMKKGAYKGYLIDKDKKIVIVKAREELAKGLAKVIKQNI